MHNPRRRYYRYQQKPRTGKGRKILARLTALLVIILAVGGLALLTYKGLAQSEFFQIADIEIEGCRRLTKDEVLELSGIDIHTNLVGLDRQGLREKLEGHDWIKKVDLDTEWSGRLTISIEERKPVALVNLDDELRYVDLSAEIFSVAAPGDEIDYPVISGLTTTGPEHPENAPLKDALLLIKYAGKTKSSSLPLQNISEINLGNDDLVLFLIDRPFPIRFGRDEVYKKYQRLSKVLYWLYKRKEFNAVAYIQVDYLQEDKVLVGWETG